MLRKKKIFYAKLADDLNNSMYDQKSFWGAVNKTFKKKSFIKNQIKAEEWFEHFKCLLENDNINNPDNLVFEDDVDVHDMEFNQPITLQEVVNAINKLKIKKAAGPDGIIAEILKYSCNKIAPFFVSFFNALFDRGIFPESWSESIIIPLYKKGDINCPNNYRGITLSNVSSKVYCSIINKRLQTWVESNNVTGEFQAGFKRGYSTIDHIFTLLSCVQKQFNYNRKLYVAFIDFEKAFDLVNRNLLWSILLKNNIKGKMFRCIKVMYSSVKVRIRSGNGTVSDLIHCNLGVKQGDAISPLLFSLFINELALNVIENGRHGVAFLQDSLVLLILLLADDAALVAETVVGLQTQLNNLQQASQTLGLRINTDKCNIIVFRKGGYLSTREHWKLNNREILVTNAYKYLGIYFSTKLSFTATCKDLAAKAKRAVICLLRTFNRLNISSVQLFFKMFDAQIQPILLYGSEVWGLDKARDNIEKVHLFTMKKLLGVELRTPNDLVYGELGRYPLSINASVRCIRFWIKILRMDSRRLPKKAYIMLKNLDDRGKQTWVSNVRKWLMQYGFGYAWLNQGVENINAFVKTFRQRLIDCRWQDWDDHMHNSERFELYSLLGNHHLGFKEYLSFNINKHFRFIFTRFRFGISNIAVHKYRYRVHSMNNLVCPLCKSSIENEVHFVLSCPSLTELRTDLIAPKYYRYPSLFKLCLLMSSSNEATIKNLVIFLYKAFKLREATIL